MPFEELKTYRILCDKCKISEIKIDSWIDPIQISKNVESIISQHYKNTLLMYKWDEFLEQLNKANWKYEQFDTVWSSTQYLRNFICLSCIMKDVIE